jgi:hypothetical protein
VITRLVLALSLAVSGVVHAMLYAHGYRHIPVVGPAFLIQAAVFIALAILIAAGGPSWFWWLAAMLSAGTLVAFGLSRTVGFAGFVEHGWNPAPQAAVSVVAQLVVVVTAGLAGWRARARRQAGARNACSASE